MPWPQAKLEVGAPNDRFEQEADRVADRVMRMPDPEVTGPIVPGGRPVGIQRLCSECEEEVRRQPVEDEEEELQMKPASPGAVPAIGVGLQAQINGLRGGGEPLPWSLRSFFEPRFGHDFSQVRIHREIKANAAAKALGARAYALGRDLVFGQGQYRPDEGPGRRLIAHELTHVVQQRSGGTPMLQFQEEGGGGAKKGPLHTCNKVGYNPEEKCCCEDRVISGPCVAGENCVDRTTRDNEYDGCSVPGWLEYSGFRDNPGLAADTWFSDREFPRTEVQDVPPRLPCDVHDKCFQTCSANPAGHWRACNQQLLIDAQAVCDNHRRAHGADYNYAMCTDAVIKGKIALPMGSWGLFKDRQREYCACCPPPTVRDAMPIYFDTDRDGLDSGEIAALKLFVDQHRALLGSGAFDLALIGHASRTGAEEYNLDLSKRRIAAVRAAIETLLGAPLSHVDEFAMGEKEAESDQRPDTDDSPDDRRVDITIAAR